MQLCLRFDRDNCVRHFCRAAVLVLLVTSSHADFAAPKIVGSLPLGIPTIADVSSRLSLIQATVPHPDFTMANLEVPTTGTLKTNQPVPAPIVVNHPVALEGSLVAAAAAAEQSITTDLPLDTFTLPKPISTGRGPRLADLTNTHLFKGLGPRPVMHDSVRGDITYSSFPGLEPVDITMAGTVGEEQVQSHLEPFHLLGGNALQRNDLLLTHDGEGMDVGGNSIGIPEAGPGLRLFEPVGQQNSVAGIGLYQRIGASGLNLVPGVDTELYQGKSQSFDLALVADSSMRLTQATKIHGWTADSLVGWNALQHQAVDSLNVSKELKDTSFFQSVSRTSGPSHGFTWYQGLSQRLGPADLLAESLHSSLNNSTEQRSALGLFTQVKRELLSIRWEGEHDSQSGIGGGQLRSSEFIDTLVVPLSNGNLIVLGDNMLSSSAGAFQHQSLITNSWQLNRLWSLQMGLSHNWISGQQSVNAAVSFWVTPTWRARLMLGPSTASELNSTHATAIGFQLVNLFDFTDYATGSIDGTVLVDGQTPTEPIKMQLEDRFTSTDSQGHFKFRHVLVGSHDVGFDLSSLSASISAPVLDQTAQVQQGKTTQVAFVAHRVGKITGNVVVDTDALGRSDPTAGIGIVITDGQGDETTTDSDQDFVLGNLVTGKHSITILSSSLPPGYTVVGANSQDIVISQGSPNANLTFHVAPPQQRIQMDALPQ
jgi:hypothetical protein